MQRTRPTDILLLVIVCLLWAGNYFVIKGALGYVDPITFAFLRALLGGIFVFAVGGFVVKGVTKKDLLWLLILGIFNVALFLIFLNESLVTASTGVSSTLVYTNPVIVAALSPLFGEKLTGRRVVGIIAAFLGIVVIFLPAILSATFVVGDLLALGASLSWSIAVLIYKRWKPEVSAYTVTAVQSVIGSAFILPLALYLGPAINPAPPLWLYLGYNVILAGGLAYVIYWRTLRHMYAAQFTSYFFLVPVLTTIMGSIFQLSIPPVNELAGTALVAIGIIAVNR